MVRSSATLGGAMNSLGGVTKSSFMGEEMRRPLRGENCLDAFPRKNGVLHMVENHWPVSLEVQSQSPPAF